MSQQVCRRGQRGRGWNLSRVRPEYGRRVPGVTPELWAHLYPDQVPSVLDRGDVGGLRLVRPHYGRRCPPTCAQSWGQCARPVGESPVDIYRTMDLAAAGFCRVAAD